MGYPLCICNGVVRSGSTWSFNVCRGLFQEQAVQLKRPFGSTYLQADQLERFITRQWPQSPGLTVVKSHELGPLALKAVHSGAAKAVCTFRDPRDCVASDLAFMKTSADACIARVNITLDFLNQFQTTKNILLVRYEDMISDSRREIRRIAVHLGVNVSPQVINQIDDKTNLQSSQKLCNSLKDRPGNTVLNIESHLVDPDTHLHDNHIHDAKVGKWKTIFSNQDGRWLTEYFASWLLKLGYETPASLAAYVGGNRSPELVPILQPTGFADRSFSVSTGR